MGTLILGNVGCTTPKDQQARDWNRDNAEAGISLFACRFPGRYREAADALRTVRRQKPLAPPRPMG